MSDAELRALERRWKETGTAEDESAFLAELVRTGRVSMARLGVAAQLGHEAALTVCTTVPTRLDFDRETALRAGLAIARELLPTWEEGVFWNDPTVGAPPPGAHGAPAKGIQSLREWLECPCRIHAEALEAAGQETRAAWKWAADHLGFPGEPLWGPSCYFILDLVGFARGESQLDLQPFLADHVQKFLGLDLASVLARESVRVELVGWLLGHEMRGA